MMPSEPPNDRRSRLLAATRRGLHADKEVIVPRLRRIEVALANIRARFEAECEEADPEDDDTVIWEPMVGRVRG